MSYVLVALQLHLWLHPRITVTTTCFSHIFFLFFSSVSEHRAFPLLPATFLIDSC